MRRLGRKGHDKKGQTSVGNRERRKLEKEERKTT